MNPIPPTYIFATKKQAGGVDFIYMAAIVGPGPALGPAANLVTSSNGPGWALPAVIPTVFVLGLEIPGAKNHTD